MACRVCGICEVQGCGLCGMKGVWHMLGVEGVTYVACRGVVYVRYMGVAYVTCRRCGLCGM